MAIFITVTDSTTGDKYNLSKNMVWSAVPNPDGTTTIITPEGSKVVNEPHDWVEHALRELN